MRFAAFIIVALPLLAQENGIYAPSEDGSGRVVKTQDGFEARLGRCTNFPVRNSTVVSQNNENTLFYISIQVPYDPGLLGGVWHTLIVNGTAYRQRGGGASAGEYSSLGFNVSDADKARQIASYLKTSVRFREHPGHRFQVSIMPEKQVYQAGEEVRVTLRIVSLGWNTVAFVIHGHNLASQYEQYVFTVRHNERHIESLPYYPCLDCLQGRQILKPGDIFEDKVSMSRWYAFREPGTYYIHGSFFLDFRDPVDASWFNSLWQDYASADFTVTVE